MNFVRKIEFYEEIQSEMRIKWLEKFHGDPYPLNFRRAIDQNQLQCDLKPFYSPKMGQIEVKFSTRSIYHKYALNGWERITNETKKAQKTPYPLNF